MNIWLFNLKYVNLLSFWSSSLLGESPVTPPMTSRLRCCWYAGVSAGEPTGRCSRRRLTRMCVWLITLKAGWKCQAPPPFRWPHDFCPSQLHFYLFTVVQNLKIQNLGETVRSWSNRVSLKSSIPGQSTCTGAAAAAQSGPPLAGTAAVMDGLAFFRAASPAWKVALFFLFSWCFPKHLQNKANSGTERYLLLAAGCHWSRGGRGGGVVGSHREKRHPSSRFFFPSVSIDLGGGR